MKKNVKSERVNVRNDNEMRLNGFFRPFEQAKRDVSVWSKTDNDRKLLKRLKHSMKGDWHFHAIPRPRPLCKAKLIVRLKNNKKFKKSVYSFECFDTEINDLIASFGHVNKNGYHVSPVISYSFNGKYHHV
jgi:hypothetical protein